LTIKAVIFDFDGVINGGVIEAFKMHQTMARQLGLRVPSLELIRQNWHGPWSDRIIPSLANKMGWPKGSVDIFVEKFRKKAEIQIGFKMNKETKKVIENFFEQGLLLAVVSNRSFESLKQGLKNLKIKNFFMFVQGKETCDFQKPDPRSLKPVLAEFKKRKIKIPEIVFVGDNGIDDYQATKNHKPLINFVGITSGATKTKEFEKLGLEKRFILSPKQFKRLPQILELF